MNKRIKLLSFTVTLLLCLTMCILTAYAAEEPVAPEVPVETSAPVVEPTAAPEVPVETTAPTADPGYIDPTVAPDSGYVEPTTDGYVDTDDGYYYYDEDDMVNNYNDTAGNVSDYTTLYDTSDFDDSALKESKWDDIAIDVSAAESDAMDFSAIKDNTQTEDDGQWIIYTGIILIGLSLIGIIYFIIATATYKKKLKRLKAREQRQRRSHEERRRDDYGDSDEYPSAEYYSRTQQRRRYSSSNVSYADRKSRKADTAEIELPRYSSRH